MFINYKTKTATILIHETITEEFAKSINEFIYGLEFLEEIENIEVSLNSPGGSVMAGFTIFSALKNSSKHTNTTVEFIAASIASVVMLGTNTLTVHDYSNIMIHNPFGGSEKVLDKVKDSIIAVYADRFGSKVGKLMDKETWFNGQKINDLGVCDSLIYSKEEETETETVFNVSEIFEISNEIVKNKFKNMSENAENEIVETVETVQNATEIKELIEKVEKLENENKELSNKLEEMKNKEVEEAKIEVLQNSLIEENEYQKWMDLDLDIIQNLTDSIKKNIQTPKIEIEQVSNSKELKWSELTSEQKQDLEENNPEEYKRLFFENK